MKTVRYGISSKLRYAVFLLGMGVVLPGLAQPSIVSTDPASMATGVSTTKPVVFTFSETMNPDLTAAKFMDTSYPPTFLPVASFWSAGNTVLTCVPTSRWLANKMIVWTVDGEDPAGDALTGTTAGFFTTGGSGDGDCTNSIGSLTVGKGALYIQTDAGASALQTNAPYAFVSCSTIACSNRADTTNLTLTVPGGQVVNVPPTIIPGHDSYNDILGSLPDLESSYPNGNYVFTFQTSSGGWPCTVNFPASLAMPNPPHLTNYDALQSANPSQACVLSWDAFQGGTAEDCIYVEIYGGVYESPAVGAPDALPGTAQSVTIPAGTLEPNTTYDGAITFYDLILNTNVCGYVNVVYRAATTEFSLVTSSGVPILEVARTDANAVVVSWPSSAPGWTLQQSTNPATGGWSECSFNISDDGTTKRVTNSPPIGSMFFRLSHQ